MASAKTLWSRIRWPFGRRAPTARIRVTLWGKADCSLCDKAQATLERLSEEYSLTVDKRDISDDPAIFERYHYLIPVVEVELGPSFEGKISEHRLRQAFDAVIGEQNQANPSV